MEKNEKELLYNKLMLILQFVEGGEFSEAKSHLEELIHRIQFNKI
jgi:hypothetical protein